MVIDVVSTETKTAWDSTVVELKNVLDHVGKDKREGCHSDDEIKRCHAALQALHEREIRLMAEVTELKTELQPSKNKEEEKKIRRRRRKLQKTFSCPPISTHPVSYNTHTHTHTSLQCVEFFHMSSGWFDSTKPSLTTSLQGKQGVHGSYALVRGGSSASNLFEPSKCEVYHFSCR